MLSLRVLSLFSGLLFIAGYSAAAGNTPGLLGRPQPPGVNYAKLPLAFEANAGQTDSQVKFLSRGHGYTLFLTGNEAVLSLAGAAGDSPRSRGVERTSSRTDPSVVRMKLIGANENAPVVGTAELPGKSNYFIGNDSKQWRTNVPTYADVKYSNVYPGVDLVYYGNQGGQLEYDFVIAPGSDPKAIRLTVAATSTRAAKGDRRSSPLAIAANGDLIVKADAGAIRFHKPLVYQNGSSGSRCAVGTDQCRGVRARFVLAASNQVSFAVGSYNHAEPLIIDPVLVYSTYLGGNGPDYGYGIAVDSSGAAYVTGSAGSTNFPTLNPLQPTHVGADHAFITKFNAAGTALVYSSYLGGSLEDGGQGISVDSAGNAYLTGYTNSSDFPTVNPVQPANGFDNEAAFVTKVNPTGSALVYSTYLGGDNGENNGSGTIGLGIAVDATGNVYVTGVTENTNFPTVNPLQATNLEGVPHTAFVTKFNAAGSAMIYSTYLGGSGSTSAEYDQGWGIAADSSGNAYVTGWTSSATFPTVNALQPTCTGCPGITYAFVAKINPTGSAFVYATYLGGSVGGVTEGYGIAADSAGNAYVTGGTTSTNFPTVNPLQASNHGTENVFLSKLNAAGSALVYSTYLGGSGGAGDQAFAIAVDSSGEAFVTGRTASTDFPTVNAFQSTKVGGLGPDTAFVSAFNAAGSALLYSTYLGGNGGERAYGIAVDSSGSAYVAGYTDSTDFPTTSGAFMTTLSSGEQDVFLTKFPPPAGASSPPPTVTITVAPTTITLGQSATLTWSSSEATSCTASGAWTGAQKTSGSASESPTAAGSSTYTLTCIGAGGSVSSSAVLTASTVSPAAPTVTLSVKPTAIAVGQSATLNWSSTNATSCTASGAWNGTQATSGSQSETPTASGNSTYELTCTGAGGSASASGVLTVSAAAAPTVTLSVSPTSITVGQSAKLSWSSTNATSCTASGAWSGTQASNGSVTVTPTSPGTSMYKLTCSGTAGAGATAAAMLQVQAATVVTALSGKAGGGGLGLNTVLCLLLLVAVRMRRFLKPRGLAMVAMLIVGGQASAQEGPTAYVGIRAGFADYTESSQRLDAALDSAGESSTSTSVTQHRAGGVVYAGMPFYRMLSFEIGFAQLGTYPVGISTQSTNIPPLAQTITHKLPPAGRGLTLDLAAPLNITSWLAVAPRLGLLAYQSKQEVFTPGGTVADDRKGAGLDAGLALLLFPHRHFSFGAGIDCFAASGRCNVLLYSAVLEYHFGGT